MQQNVTYSTPSDSLAGFKGAALRRGGERKRRGREEMGRRAGEGKLTLMRSWNRAADWLRPALHQPDLG